jgi:hypothetical protein
MAVTLQGIRLDAIKLDRDDKDGSFKVSGHYSLVSSKGKVLAGQEVGGYNGMQIPMDAETTKAMQQFVDLYTNNITSLIGLDEDS